MPDNIFSDDIKAIERSGYICHPGQLYSARRVTVSEGRAKGTEIIEICTAGGLQVEILPSTGLDIGQVRFKGANMTFISRNGYDNPSIINPYETEFLNTFPGGMVYTCGLRTTGGAHRDGDEWQTLHGRYHSRSAEMISIDEDDEYIIVKGTVRETALFGYTLELKRTISIKKMGADIKLSDEITNKGFKDEEYAILYHCNFGYPFISAEAHVELPENRKTTARTPFAKTGLGKETTFSEPVPNEEERVFFHENMEHKAAIVNESIHTRLDMTWSDTLPILAHWRSMASGDYVCGLEPSNNYIMGRHYERENGTLKVLRPDETVKTQVTFSFLTI